jgi:hypothetical protein
MYYLYRDFSIAGWVTLAAFALFAAGVSCGRRGCRGVMAWVSLGSVAVVAAGLVFGARFYSVVTQDLSLDAYFRTARQVAWVPVVVFLVGLVWGWYVSRRSEPGVDVDRGFEVMAAPSHRRAEREER